MARKMTQIQGDVLAQINEGWPEAMIGGTVPARDDQCLRVLTHHCCMDGAVVRCHRTVKTSTPAGSQVQGFRIHPDGTAVRFI